MDISAEIIEFKVPTDNNKTLFVWNITAFLSEEETYIILMKTFSEFGLLYSIKVCKNAVVAEPGFYAIVKFYSARDASQAQRACDKKVLFQDFPLKVRVCTKQKGYQHLGCGLNSVKCQDVANHYLGFNGWSKRIIMIQNISGFDDLEDEDTEVEPEGKNLKYLCVIEVALHKHGLCSRGVGVGEEKLENPKDTLEFVMKTGKTQKFAVQKALSDAFQKILLVVLENGKVAAEYSSVREEAVDCLSEEELHGLIKVSAYEKGDIWLDIIRAVRSEGGLAGGSVTSGRGGRTSGAGPATSPGYSSSSKLHASMAVPATSPPHMLRVLEVVFPDLHRQLQEGQQQEGASSPQSGGDTGADQTEGPSDSATCFEESEGGSGTEGEESQMAGPHEHDTYYLADGWESDSPEEREYAAMPSSTSLAVPSSSSTISTLPVVRVPRVRASPRVSFVPGTAAPAPVSPAALSAESVDLLRKILVGQTSMLTVLHGHTQIMTQLLSFMEGMSSAMSDLHRSVAAIESSLTAALSTQQHLPPPPSDPSTSASPIPAQCTRRRHRSDTTTDAPSTPIRQTKRKSPRTQSKGDVGTPTGRGDRRHTRIHRPTTTDSQPFTSTPNVSLGSGGSFSELAEVCSQVYLATFCEAPASVEGSTPPAPTTPVFPLLSLRCRRIPQMMPPLFPQTIELYVQASLGVTTSRIRVLVGQMHS
ncbi:RAD52 motif-containing protein 1 isoform X1 [Lissotriton helveticus]